MTFPSEKLAVFNETRLTILRSLYECEKCGCDLVDILDIPKNLLSHHIKTLINFGYIQEDRCGRKKRYSIREDSVDKVNNILETVERL